MFLQEDRMARVEAVQRKYEADLMRKSHVIGVGIGVGKREGEPTDEICLVVMVDQKMPVSQLGPRDRIPSQLEGVRVDVQEIGVVSAQ